MFGGWKIAGFAIGGTVLLLGAGFAFFKYQENKYESRIEILQGDLDLVKENNVKLESVNNTNQNTINRLNEERERNQRLVQDLNMSLRDSENPSQELREILNRHDLEGLAYEKPGLIERRMNDGTKKVFDRIEQLTFP